MDIGDRISSRRKDLGLTLEEVGNIVGVGKSTVRKWETGYIENMKRDKIALLAKALMVSPTYLMGWDETSLVNTDEIKNGFIRIHEGIISKYANLNPENKKVIDANIDFLLNRQNQGRE